MAVCVRACHNPRVGFNISIYYIYIMYIYIYLYTYYNYIMYISLYIYIYIDSFRGFESTKDEGDQGLFFIGSFDSGVPS